MIQNKCKGNIGGFTLIELLVVVLIIGILSAVALPQYQKTVLKSRTAEAWANLSALKKAQQVFCMENEGSTTSGHRVSDLAIEVEDSAYFSYTLPTCSGAQSGAHIYAYYKKSPSFFLAIGDSGMRLCEGDGCRDLGFSSYGSRVSCICGGAGSSCYYME